MMRKPNWLGTLALIGTFLICLGLSMASAGVIEDKVLPNILQQLQDEGKEVQNSAVIDMGEESQIVVTMKNGEVRKYDGQGQIKEVVDPNGKKTLYEDGLPVKQLDAQGGVISETKYTRRNGKIVQSVETGRAGLVTKMFDRDGNIIQMTDAQGTKIFSNYVKNAKGKTTSYKETDLATNETVTKLLDPKSGEVIGKIDAKGIKTEIEVRTNQLGEKTETIERSSNGKIVTKKFVDGQMVEKNENGQVTKYKNIVNGQGMLVSTKETKIVKTLKGSFEETVTKDYDEVGRISKLVDAKGIHEFTYEVDGNGRVVGRREKLRAKENEPAKTIYQKYNEFGQVVMLIEDGKQTNTDYVLDDAGNILKSTETISFQFGNQTATDKITKEYDKQGHVVAEVNGIGQRTEYTYDGNGNQVTVKKEHEFTQNVYDEHDNLLYSTTKDHKSTTITYYDVKTKLATKKVHISNSGVVENTIYGLNGNGERTAVTVTAFGIKTAVTLNNQSDQPKHVVFVKNNGKTVTTDYQYAGDHMLSSKEVGPDGITETIYNIYGKPKESARMDQFGREYFTDYQYQNGKMVSSIQTDKKGTTTTKFNEFEDPDTIVRINVIGYPRKSVEKRMYKDGMLSESESTDVKGRSLTYYNEHELAARVHRINKHGFPREHWVTNIYDQGGRSTAVFRMTIAVRPITGLTKTA